VLLAAAREGKPLPAIDDNYPSLKAHYLEQAARVHEQAPRSAESADVCPDLGKRHDRRRGLVPSSQGLQQDDPRACPI
jgi:hypothetical protein